MWIKVKVPDDFDSSQKEIGGMPIFTPEYHRVLDHGWLSLVDFMGSDQDIVDAARVSYGKGTRRVNSDRALIRYLLRHAHTTPFEMVQFKFHVKLPIFVARQWIRHRTGSFNEYSARYSKLDREMYVPERAHAMPQSKTNKQGREVLELNEQNYNAVVAAMENAFEEAFTTYMYLLGPEEITLENGQKAITNPRAPDAIERRVLVWKEAAIKGLEKAQRLAEERGEEFSIDDAMIDAKIKEYYEANGLAVLDQDYPGLARELARCVIPVAVYTQWYWSVNLHNLMHFIKLRSDSHAQYEVRVYSDLIKTLIEPLVPMSVEAFDEYVMYAKKVSRTEHSALINLLSKVPQEIIETEISSMKVKGASQREIDEFRNTFFTKVE